MEPVKYFDPKSQADISYSAADRYYWHGAGTGTGHTLSMTGQRVVRSGGGDGGVNGAN